MDVFSNNLVFCYTFDSNKMEEQALDYEYRIHPQMSPYKNNDVLADKIHYFLFLFINWKGRDLAKLVYKLPEILLCVSCATHTGRSLNSFS